MEGSEKKPKEIHCVTPLPQQVYNSIASSFRASGQMRDIESILHSCGYMEAKISTSFGTIYIFPGPQYRLTSVTFESMEPHLHELFDSCCSPLVDQPYDSKQLNKTVRQTIKKMGSIGYPYPSLVHVEAEADRTTRTISVHYHIQPGIRAKFGNTSITGLHNIQESVVSSRIYWNEGEWFNLEKVKKTKSLLVGEKIFSSVFIKEQNPTDQQEIPMLIHLEEGKMRKILFSFGGSGAFDHHPSFADLFTNISFENRNVLEKGYDLQVRGHAAKNKQILNVEFRIPLLPKEPTSLKTSLLFHKVHALPFSGYQFEMGQEVCHTYPSSKGPMGYRIGHITESPSYNKELVRKTWFMGLFASKSWSIKSSPAYTLSLKNLLNTTWTPTSPFILHSTSGLIRVPLGRFGFASLLSRCSILYPQTKFLSWRIYAGGANSVKGYVENSISPLTDSGWPEGGASSLVGSAEFHFPIFRDTYLIFFGDGGNVYRSSFPNFEGGWYTSAGVGLSYQSPVGPFRLDVAIPLNRVDSQHIPHQRVRIYISLLELEVL